MCFTSCLGGDKSVMQVHEVLIDLFLHLLFLQLGEPRLCPALLAHLHVSLGPNEKGIGWESSDPVCSEQGQHCIQTGMLIACFIWACKCTGTDSTTVLDPCSTASSSKGETPFSSRNLAWFQIVIAVLFSMKCLCLVKNLAEGLEVSRKRCS